MLGWPFRRKPFFEIRINCTVHEVGTLIVDMSFSGNKAFYDACRKHGITSKEVDDKIKAFSFVQRTGWVPDGDEDEQDPERWVI